MIRKVLASILLVLSLVAPAHADLVFAPGTFTITSGTGTQQITDAACAQPRVVITWWDRNTAEGFAAHAGFGFGVAVDRATTDQQANTTFYNTDNVATTDSANAKTLASFIRNQANVTPAFNVVAAISSFNADGFTINKTTNDNANLNIIKYVCLSGSDITDAYLGEFLSGTGTGSRGFTGVGFQGNLALFFGAAFTAAGATSATDYEFHLGAANGAQQGTAALYGNDGSGSANQAESYADSGVALAIMDGGTLTSLALASFTQFDSDGFTLNFTKNTTADTPFFALILKGTFQSHIGQQARPTGTGNQDYTTGFPVVGTLITGTFATANATETVQGHFSLGACTASVNHGKWWGDAASINTDVNMYSSSANVYTQATNPSTVAAQAACATAANSTSYRLNWGTADATARLFSHIAFGAAASGRRPIAPILFQ